MNHEAPALIDLVLQALRDMKAQSIILLDVRLMTSMTDFMLVCSGTSDRHVKAIAENVVEKVKAARYSLIGVEGEREGEWVLIDVGEMMIHIMLPRTRDFYQLEKLWQTAQNVLVR